MKERISSGHPGWRHPLEPNCGVDARSGLLEERKGVAVNFMPIPVSRGMQLCPRAASLRWRLYAYSTDIAPELVHTYAYQPEANWATFRPDWSDDGWRQGRAEAGFDGYARIAVAGAAPGARLCDLFEEEIPRPGPAPDWIAEEADRVAARVSALRRSGDAVLLLISDTHETTGGIWRDTLRCLKETAGRVGPDRLIHLGDLTDGMLPADYTMWIAGGIRRDMEALGLPLDGCLGNHDWNAFRGNPGRLTAGQCARSVLGRDTPWTKADLPQARLRLVYLDSFDPERGERYGFSGREMLWLWRTLARTPKGWRVAVFSHVPPLPEIHVWSKRIRGGETVLRLLERHHRRRGRVLCWIHGHNHVDQTMTTRMFPIVGIGCGKLEDFHEHKPAGGVTPPRRRGGPSQELFDVVLIHMDNSVDFIRFGAGEDRHLEGDACHAAG